MDWTTHPGMNNLDPLKREIIRTAAKQVQGKSGNQMATVMMALITSATSGFFSFNIRIMSWRCPVLPPINACVGTGSPSIASGALPWIT